MKHRHRNFLNETNTIFNYTTSNAPSFSSLSQDVCSMGVSGALSTGIFSTSVGKHFRDMNCERIKLAKVLQDFGMKVASVAVLCQDKRVFQYPTLRPDYKLYTERTKVKQEIDAKDNKIIIIDLPVNRK